MRTKFNVAEIVKYGNGGGTKVTLFPLMRQSEENEVNGKIEIHFSNPDTEFELGEYYIDFTKVE